MDEWLWVVDENDRPAGKALRSDVRKKLLLHRGTAVIVYNTKGHILVHRRTDTKDIFPGYFDIFVGGAVQYGESAYENARRELFEEIGAGCEPEFLFVHRFRNKLCNAIIYVYMAVFDGTLALQEEEVAWAGFVDKAELRRMLAEKQFCPDGIDILRRIEAQGPAYEPTPKKQATRRPGREIIFG